MTWDFVYQIRRFELVKSIIITILQRWQMILHMKYKGTNWTNILLEVVTKKSTLTRIHSEFWAVPISEQIPISNTNIKATVARFVVDGFADCTRQAMESLVSSTQLLPLIKKIVTINGQKTEQKFEACCHSECCSGKPSELCCKAKWPVFDIS